MISESTSKGGNGNQKQYQSAIDSIVQYIRVVFPQLPKHFQIDAVNVLVVLSHQLDYTLRDLLLKARAWSVLPKTTTTG